MAEAVWQYSYHVLPGLLSHQGPILTVANWSGTWPGLVGMLNLNGSPTKAGKKYSTLWSEDFTEKMFVSGLKEWLAKGKVKHPTKHVKPLKKIKVPGPEGKLGKALADQLAREKAIMGIFDEGCMGMYNAIIQDELLNPLGVYKERLSQSALYYETTQVDDNEAREVRKWMEDRGMKFLTGPNEETDLTDNQIHHAVQDVHRRRAHGRRFRLQRNRHSIPARTERPVAGQRSGRRHAEQRRPPAGQKPRRQTDPIRGRAAAAFQRSRRMRGPGRPDDLPRTQGHGPARGNHPARRPLGRLGPLGHGKRLRLGVRNLRFGAPGSFNRRLGRRHQRTPTGNVLPLRRRIDKRHFQARRNRLVADLRRRRQAENGPGPRRRRRTPPEETQRRWDLTTPQWPIMHAVLYGVSRDQFMAKHKANHIQVAYAQSAKDADSAMLAKAAMARAMGMEVSICGTRKGNKAW